MWQGEHEASYDHDSYPYGHQSRFMSLFPKVPHQHTANHRTEIITASYKPGLGTRQGVTLLQCNQDYVNYTVDDKPLKKVKYTLTDHVPPYGIEPLQAAEEKHDTGVNEVYKNTYRNHSYTLLHVFYH